MTIIEKYFQKLEKNGSPYYLNVARFSDQSLLYFMNVINNISINISLNVYTPVIVTLTFFKCIHHNHCDFNLA